MEKETKKKWWKTPLKVAGIAALVVTAYKLGGNKKVTDKVTKTGAQIKDWANTKLANKKPAVTLENAPVEEIRETNQEPAASTVAGNNGNGNSGKRYYYSNNNNNSKEWR